jgi:aryl sulfotransferase
VIARFLDIDIDEARFPTIVDHCTFNYMKVHAEQMAPGGGGSWVGGAQTFINKGTNGRWRDVLTPGEVAEFDAKAVRELGADCAEWLSSGTIRNRRPASAQTTAPAAE